MKKSRMKKSRAVQMFSPARPVLHGLAFAVLLAAAPARAAGAVTIDSVLAGAGRLASEAGTTAAVHGQWLAAEATLYGQRFLAGDMAAIRNGTFGFSGLIALIGLWAAGPPPPRAQNGRSIWSHPTRASPCPRERRPGRMPNGRPACWKPLPPPRRRWRSAPPSGSTCARAISSPPETSGGPEIAAGKIAAPCHGLLPETLANPARPTAADVGLPPRVAVAAGEAGARILPINNISLLFIGNIISTNDKKRHEERPCPCSRPTRCWLSAS